MKLFGDECGEFRKGALLAFASCAAMTMFASSFGESLRRVIGIDVNVTQKERVQSVALPQSYGVFTNATVFADKDRRVHQIRCVRAYAPDVTLEKIVPDIEAVVVKLTETFPVTAVVPAVDKECSWRRHVLFGETEWSAQLYVTEAKNHNKSLGYNIADLTFLRKKTTDCKRCGQKPCNSASR